MYLWLNKERDFGSENVVDGMYCDCGIKGQCIIFDDGKYNVIWRVDFGRVVFICYIDIYYWIDNKGIYLKKYFKEIYWIIIQVQLYLYMICDDNNQRLKLKV